MNNEDDWSSGLRPSGSNSIDVHATGMSMIRFALLFGSAAIALALLATPLLSSSTQRFTSVTPVGSGLDTMSTGSVGGGQTRYTIRRSVLQQDPSAACIIHDNGVRTGGC